MDDPEAQGAAGGWAVESLDDSGWKNIAVPGEFEQTLDLPLKGKFGYYVTFKSWATDREMFNGIAWYRRKVVVPEAWKGKKIFLEPGLIGNFEWAYFNSEVIGVFDTADEYKAGGWQVNVPRRYPVPERLVRFGKENTIAVQVFNPNGPGGILGPQVRLAAY